MGKTGAAKALALDIHEGNLDILNVDVAVHTYGAVPIYLVPRSAVSLEIFGQRRDCEVGIFVSGRDTESLKIASDEGLREPINSLFLVRSLRIRPDLTFIRYMEDVGEYVYDLRTKRNWTAVFRYGRKIEDLLNASVKSKILTVLNHATVRGARSSSEVGIAIHAESHKYLQEYSALLYKFSTARIIYLFVLNHMYRAVGMKDKCAHYDEEYRESWREFFRSNTELGDVRESDPEIAALAAVWNCWHSSNPQQALAWFHKQSGSLAHWLQRLVDFAYFASTIVELNTNRDAIKLFFSSRHVPTMKQTRQEVDKLFRGRFGGRASVLYVESEQPSFSFRDQIAPQIWLSDVVLSVYSPKLDSAATDRCWVSYELVLARGFQLPDMVVRESSVTLEEIQRRLSVESPALASELINGETITALPDEPSARVRFLEPYLFDKVREATMKKCETLIRGFLQNFFTKEQIYVISRVHLFCLDPVWPFRNKNGNVAYWIEIGDLSDALKMNARSMRKVLSDISQSERALSFGASGVTIPPLVIDLAGKRCRGNLLAAMELLRPDLSGAKNGEEELRNSLIGIMKTLL
jgi:hypothetical protein